MSIEREGRAYEALQALLKQAESCRTLFDEANLAYPEPLKRVLGVESMNGAGTDEVAMLRIGPPRTQSRPDGAPGDWLAIPTDGMMVQTAIPAILRQNGALPVKSIVGEFARLGVKASAGSIANAGTRLETQGVIRRDKSAGWHLVNPSQAPILNGLHVWGPRDGFTKQELASRRREAIQHLLSQVSGGLQVLQILEFLKRADWLGTPLSKDLIKVDMEELQRDGLVRRTGNSRKWVLT